MLKVKGYLCQASYQRWGSLDAIHVLAASNNASISGFPVQGLYTWYKHSHNCDSTLDLINATADYSISQADLLHIV